MDMTSAIVPKSDQLNAEDLLTGPRVFTIVKVSKGSDEQPVNIQLEETPGRVYRPSKSMSRVLVNAWGREADAYAGRKLKLFRNPEIMFGRDKVGGIEIAELSHIDKQVALALTVTRGKRKSFIVKPLKDVAPAQEPGAVPQDVIEKADKYVAEGKVPQYLEWLTSKGAPMHILDYVQSKLPKAEDDGLSWSSDAPGDQTQQTTPADSDQGPTGGDYAEPSVDENGEFRE
jgi:hypothetical protein